MITHSVKYTLHAPALTNSAAVPATPAPVTASPVTKLRRLRRELTTWAKAGAKLVPREFRRERLAICGACPYWSAAGNLGLGECKYPGCGCTRVKAALSTSKCPHIPPKWGAFHV